MPTDTNQAESMTVRPQVREFFEHFEQPSSAPLPAEELIQVSPATKRIAFAYERFRNTLEPDEQEILRRRAISRILERRLFEDRPTEVIAATLLQELIRGSYIKPSPRSLAVEVGKDLKKAKQVYAAIDAKHHAWFLSVMSVAIDHRLFPPNRQEALVHLMYHDTQQRVAWTDNYIGEKDRPTQLYLACHRTLYAADDNELTFHYFVHQFPAWQQDELGHQDLEQIAKGIPSFRQHMEHALNHEGRDRLTRLVRPVSVSYLILRDVLKERGQAALQSIEALESAGADAFRDRIQLTRSRMSRRAWHSILFLFMTKTLLALLIEVPYERFALNEVHTLALMTNIAFHPLLLFMLATAVRIPGQSNTERVIEHLKRIVTGEGELPTVVVNQPRRYGSATWSAFAIIYSILFLLIFWGMFAVLARLDFSLLAMFFFVVFLGLVSFLATRIRRSVDDLRVIPKREGAVSAITSFLALPVLEFGRWLAQHIRQLNFLLFIMDRILEAPFKLLIDVTEEWFDFVRDRREEIVK